jgi:hypothetical protein
VKEEGLAHWRLSRQKTNTNKLKAIGVDFPYRRYMPSTDGGYLAFHYGVGVRNTLHIFCVQKCRHRSTSQLVTNDYGEKGRLMLTAV